MRLRANSSPSLPPGWELKDEAKSELLPFPSSRVGARATVQRCTHCRASAAVAGIGRTDCRETGRESWSGALHV